MQTRLSVALQLLLVLLLALSLGAICLGLLIVPDALAATRHAPLLLFALLYLAFGGLGCSVALNRFSTISIESGTRTLTMKRWWGKTERWPAEEVKGYTLGAAWTRFGSTDQVILHRSDGQTVTFVARGTRNFPDMKAVVMNTYRPFDPNAPKPSRSLKIRRQLNQRRSNF